MNDMITKEIGLRCGLPMVLRPRAFGFEFEHRFRWLGSLVLPGLEIFQGLAVSIL